MIAIVTLLAGALAGSARADGDPASDVLLSQPLFLPADAGVSAGRQAQLGALLAAARRDGYAMRVAVIAGRADLGSVTALWRRPHQYARFLGQELALGYQGPLLVVMPNGYGLYRSRGVQPGEQSALTALAPAGRNLGTGALTAVGRLAAAAGHNVPLPAVGAPGDRGSTDVLAWIVFALGAVVILAAWAASLRARPPHPLRRSASPS